MSRFLERLPEDALGPRRVDSVEAQISSSRWGSPPERHFGTLTGRG
ncbi:MAG: hypothetical protein ACRDZO_22325 [Egibacteraceae bacterium]